MSDRYHIASFKERRACWLQSGFSQVELLFAMAILAILLAIAVPVYRSTLTRSQHITCTSNLRVLGTAMHAYAADNDGFLPPGYRVPLGGTFNRILVPYTMPMEKTTISSKVFYCPTNLSLGTPPEDGFQWEGYLGYSGYFLNYLINASIFRITSHDPTTSSYVTDADARVLLWSIRDPARTVALMDMRTRAPGAGGPPTSGLARNTYFNPSHTQWSLGTVHSGQGNILFIDGHVESFPPEPLPVMSLPDQETPWF